MPQSFFLKGLLVALIFGIPAGPIGALTIQHTLQKGFKAGVITGLGSTAADMFYACIGICGITFVSDFITKYQQWIRLLGGAFIIFIGLSIFRKKETIKEADVDVYTLPKYFFTSFGIALMNPATVFSFMIAFALVEVPSNTTILQAEEIICGILCGTAIWWIALSGITCVLSKKLNTIWIQRINRVLGCFMIAMGGIFIFHG